MTLRRNLMIVVALAALGLVALLLIGSLLSDLAVPSPVATVTPPPPTGTPTLEPSTTPSLTPTASITASPTSVPSLTPSPTAPPTASPTTNPRVFLAPFSQVFAVGQAQPNNSSQVLMYQGNNDTFEAVGVQGAFTRLQTLDGGMNFWTATTSVVASPLPPPQYDYSVRGKTAKLYPASLFACARSDRPTLAFGVCQPLNGISSAILVARIAAGGNSLYVADIGGAQYLIPATAVSSISG